MAKTLLLFFVAALTVVSGYRRRNANMPEQIQKMQNLIHEATKYIDEEAAEDGKNTIRIQIAANNFCYYMEEATNSMIEAINLIKDPGAQKVANDFVDFGIRSTYNIEKNLNGDGKSLKKAVKYALLRYVTVVEKALAFFPKGDVANDESLRIINAAREAFDIVLFNFEFILIQLKYYNDSASKILELISTQLEKIYNFLDNITTNDKQLTGELSVYIHHLSRPIDVLLRKMERWTYVYKNDEKNLTIINNVITKLSENLAKLKKSTLGSTETQSLAKNVKEYFQSCFVLVKSLTDVENPQKLDALKLIALEILAVVTTFNDNIELYKTKKVA